MISRALAATAVELAKTQSGGEIIAYFPKDWLLSGALASPIIMLLSFVAKEVYNHYKGDNKKIREDLDDLKLGFMELKTMLGHDLDHKIERKIDKAFEYYEKGRRH